jgi:hypothetical protein
MKAIKPSKRTKPTTRAKPGKTCPLCTAVLIAALCIAAFYIINLDLELQKSTVRWLNRSGAFLLLAATILGASGFLTPQHRKADVASIAVGALFFAGAGTLLLVLAA